LISVPLFNNSIDGWNYVRFWEFRIGFQP
jgi:hypothetical protein